jgi:plasmid stabilization system protein ParE
MKVIITAAARVDLVSIGRRIAADNPRRAASFVDELVDRCEDLAEMGERFQVLTQLATRDIRRRPYKNYLIFYRIAGDGVEVLHILHGAQDWQSMLFDSDDPEI